MRILVSGSTGLLGSRLARALEERGDEVWRLDRRPSGVRSLAWPGEMENLDAVLPEGLEAVVHLAGSPIAAWPWSESTRRLIHDSRILTTHRLAAALATRAARGERVHLLAGSAVGGLRPGWPVRDESSPLDGTGYLAAVVRDWEAAAAPARGAGLPVAFLRTGLALDTAGGLLGRLWPVWRRGLGLRLGSPELPWSWIHAEDWLRAVQHILDRGLDGPFHLCVPDPVPQRAAWEALDRVAGRRSWPGPPDALVALLGGAMARELLLSAPAARPGRLLETGFAFRHPDLEPALRQLVEGR